MNEVFLIGKIVSDVKFEFMIDSKNISVSGFKIQTLDRQVVDINVYDALADLTYSKLNIGDIIMVYGYLSHRCVIGEEFKKL